jgi:hypothetical protein
MGRSLETHPRSGGSAASLSPAQVSCTPAEELARLPRPVVAYGLIEDVADARACALLADAIVVRPPVAARLAAEATRGALEEEVLLRLPVTSAP